MKEKKSLAIFFLMFFMIVNLLAQKKEFPTTRFILPLAYTIEPYGIDNITSSIVSSGSFDNYILSSSAGFMECDVAVNRSNPLNFVATDNRIITGANYVYYTTNGGVSWSYSTVTTSYGDPCFASDASGNFYLAYLGYGSGVRFQKSTNGGQSWATAVSIVTSSSVDKEWIACDQTTGTYQNNVYMAYFNTTTSSQRVDFYKSTNNGTSWTGPTILASTVTTNPGPNIVVDYTGKVYVFITTSSGAVYTYSTDGGTTFSTITNAASYIEPGIVNATSSRYCVKGNIRTNGHPQAATDLSNGPYKGYTYISYAANPPGADIANVYVARTTNGGTSFEYSLLINDDGTTRDQWMSDISVDDSGRVWVFWYDSRNDASNILTEIYGAVSTNGGATFSANFKVSNQNFNPNTIKQYQSSEHYYIGDYNGMSGRTFTFPVYSGQNNSLQDYTAYLPDYGVSFLKSSDSLTVSNTSVNYVEIPMMGPYSGTVTYTASVSPTPSTGSITFVWSPSNVKVLAGTPDSLKLSATTSSNCSYGTYTVTVTGAESGGPRTHTRTYILVVGSHSSGISNNGQIAGQFNLFQNYPNPFNPTTSIEYYLTKQSMVTLKVYDVMGREIATLINNDLRKAGLHQVNFNGTNLSSGIYYYKINTGEFTDIKKMMLVK
jgi:hypothetical protein